jgi:hypothetical protein
MASCATTSGSITDPPRDGLGGVEDGGRPGQSDAHLGRAAAAGLAKQGRILRDPVNRRLSGHRVLQKVAPWLRASASESARFNRALADYRQVVDRCTLQAS